MARLPENERPSTGGLARLARWFAYHPWRTILGWVAIIVVLVGLVATIGGSLKDEFDIPGSDTQRATDLIESKFASEQGGVLNVVFAAPVGERLDTPQRKAAIEAAVAKARTEFAPASDTPVDGKAGLEDVKDPFAPDTVSKDGRIAYAEAQFDQTIEDKDRDAVVRVEDFFRDAVAPVGVPSSTTATRSSRPSSRGRPSCWACWRPSSCCWSCSARSSRCSSPSRWRSSRWRTAFLLLFIFAGLTPSTPSRRSSCR